MDRYVGYKINEFLLVGVILIQFGDFLKILPPFWDYINKIINWFLIGALLYASAPSEVFFGERRAWWDASVVIACFGMVLKNIVSYAVSAQHEILENVMNVVGIVPTFDAVRDAVVIPVSGAAYASFTLIGGYLPNATLFVKPFATQLTLTNPSVALAIQAGNQTTNALIEPYGLDGVAFQIYNTLVQHGGAIQQWGFLIGSALLIALGVYAALRFPVQEKSVLGLIHEHGAVNGVQAALTRILSVLFIIAAYFVILFNLGVEWLAMAVDAPLAMLGVLVVIFVVFHSRRRDAADEESAVDKMGNFGNDFLTGFDKLFERKGTVLLGLCGLLVLHLLTDVGNFLIPYFTGLVDPLYFSHLGPGHDTLSTLIRASWNGSFVTDGAILLLYLLNAIAVTAFLTLPAYIWYKAYKIRTRLQSDDESDHHPDLPGWLVALCLVATLAFLLAPTFRFTEVKDASLVGVDLQTKPLAVGDPILLAAILLCAFVLLLLIGFSPARLYLMALLFLESIFFFGFYIYHFFFATITYYLRESVLLLHQATPTSVYLAAWLFVFLIINLLFYVFGFFSFAYESWRD